MRPIIIIGKLCSGKTIVADYLVKNYKYKKYSMANWLKRVVDIHYNLDHPPKSTIIKDKPIRDYYIAVGEGFRKIDPEWHIDETISLIKSNGDNKVFVIDDVRYMNELTEFKKNFNCISIKLIASKRIRLERSILRDMVVPTEEQFNSPSETESDQITTDYEIVNEDSLDLLFNKLNTIIKEIK